MWVWAGVHMVEWYQPDRYSDHMCMLVELRGGQLRRRARFFLACVLPTAKGQLMSTWARERWPFWIRDSGCARQTPT